MDIELLIVMAGVLGIVLSAIMSSYGYLYRVRTEHKRNSRKALYTLLEIRFSIFRTLLEPEAVRNQCVAKITTRMQSHGFTVDDGEIPETFTRAIDIHLKNVIEASIKDVSSELKPEYEDALALLALENPVLAYSLRGREAISMVLGHTESYLRTAKANLADLDAEDWVKNSIAASFEEAKRKVEQDIIQMLNGDVEKLSKACGRRDKRAVSRLLSKQQHPSDTMDFSEIDYLFDNLIMRLVEAAKNNINQGQGG